MIKKVELLSPAGSYKGMEAAFNAGADAVYLGGNKFGARAYANNFSDEELLQAIDYAHLKDKKIYLTLNTLLKEKEIKNDLFSYLKPFYMQGLDAVIVQDTGIIRFLREYFPDLPIHASTQMTVTSLEGVDFLRNIGIKRVVTARELSLKELKHIISNTDTEIEAFIHGAMCYSYSGQCLMSSILGGRSGNRGRCAQPCRLNYSTSEKDAFPLLSLKDMCTYPILAELITSGISSFKIEGRMKSPEYTGGVTSIYRYQIDKIEEAINSGLSAFDIKPDKKEFDKLIKLYSRGVSGTGYYFMKNGPEMLSGKESGYSKDQNAVSFDKNVSSQPKTKKIPLDCKAEFLLGRPAKISVNYKNISVCINGDIVEKAKTTPVTYENILEKLNKTGNTEFYFNDIELIADDDIFYSLKGINDLRRTVLNDLNNRIVLSYRRSEPVDFNSISNVSEETNSKKNLTYSALVNTKDQLYTVVDFDKINTIYLERTLWNELNDLKASEFTENRDRNIILCLPHIMRKNTVDELNNNWNTGLKELFDVCDGVLIRNLESYEFLSKNNYKGKIILDSSLYTWNRKSIEFWKSFNICETTIPFELNFHEIKERGTENSELVVYGYIPLMLSAQCVQKNLFGCAKINNKKAVSNNNFKKEFINNNMNCYRMLKDRYGKEFPVYNRCTECYNIIYNSLPLDLTNDIDRIKSIGVSGLRYQFTIETAKETRNILKGNFKSEFTRGHFNRGAE